MENNIPTSVGSLIVEAFHEEKIVPSSFLRNLGHLTRNRISRRHTNLARPLDQEI